MLTPLLPHRCHCYFSVYNGLCRFGRTFLFISARGATYFALMVFGREMASSPTLSFVLLVLHLVLFLSFWQQGISLAFQAFPLTR
jgi:hypothetical protein